MASPSHERPTPTAFRVLSDDGGPQRIVVPDHLDRTNAAAVREVIVDACLSGASVVLLDLSRVGRADKVAVRMLVGCRRRAGSLGIELVLQRPSDVVVELLARTGLSRVFPVATSAPFTAPVRTGRRRAAGRR